MGNLIAKNQWVDVPYFESNAVLTGGPDCPDNIPIQALADRTEHLQQSKQDALGFPVVQQGTGTGQLGNYIKIGWDGNRLRVTVDTTDLGPVVFDGNLAAAIADVNAAIATGIASLSSTIETELGTKQPNLGYTPVQQGTGIGQLQNIIKIGWNGSRVSATVDTNDMGPIVFDGNLTGQVGYFAMTTPPSGWLKANGAAVSRTAYSDLFKSITLKTTGTTTSGSATISSVASTTGMAVGMPISGPGIPAGATLTAVTASSLTISANATATASGVSIVVAPSGVGDGSTTFNLPDLRGEFLRGFDDARGVDTGRVFSSQQGDAIRNIYGSVSGSSQFSYFDGATGALYCMNSYNLGFAASGSLAGYNDMGIDASKVVPTASENRPRNVAMLACIKY